MPKMKKTSQVIDAMLLFFSILPLNSNYYQLGNAKGQRYNKKEIIANKMRSTDYMGTF